MPQGYQLHPYPTFAMLVASTLAGPTLDPQIDARQDQIPTLEIPMKNETPAGGSARVLVVGRSPSVLRAAVDLLRGKGYLADVTNQFDRVLDEYDVSDLDVLVFGGMVPPETKQYLREEITKRNAGVTFVQGMAGIPGVIAAQVEAVTGGRASGDADIAYSPED